MGCHSTGYAASGDRWAMREATTRLRDVGCESCHGPSLAHVTSPDKRGTTRRAVAQTVCLGWHWSPYAYSRTADDTDPVERAVQRLGRHDSGDGAEWECGERDGAK